MGPRSRTFLALQILASLLCLALLRPALAMDLQLSGKTALITGSTGGIGFGIAKVLLKESGVRLSRFYLPGMKQRNWGRIIFISSESALQIPVESVAYGMSKAAQIAVARGLAEGCAKTGVTVNSILPGPTLDADDPRAARRFGGRSFAQAEEEFINTRRPTSLIKRFAHTDEVASLVAYVASPLSSATTGAALRVDGGVVKSAF